MILLAIPAFVLVVLAGGGFVKWGVHITHTWWPLVPEIPYGTACLSFFVTALGCIVMGLLSAWAFSLFD